MMAAGTHLSLSLHHSRPPPPPASTAILLQLENNQTQCGLARCQPIPGSQFIQSYFTLQLFTTQLPDLTLQCTRVLYNWFPISPLLTGWSGAGPDGDSSLLILISTQPFSASDWYCEEGEVGRVYTWQDGLVTSQHYQAKLYRLDMVVILYLYFHVSYHHLSTLSSLSSLCSQCFVIIALSLTESLSLSAR